MPPLAELSPIFLQSASPYLITTPLEKYWFSFSHQLELKSGWIKHP
jgi:hypothetical protein